MIFILVLGLITLALASSAAYFSVWGMAQIFAGAFIPTIIMGSSLEVGKLIAASFLYRNWKDTGYFLRAYLFSAIFVLMIVTSIGIFGFLTAAYQKDTIPLNETTQLIESYESELIILNTRKLEIDKQIAEMPPTYVTAKQRLMDSFKEEINKINPRIEILTSELQRLKVDVINIESKIGPLIFVSKVLGRDANDAVFYFVLILICVFDPLAVALTIATNICIKKRAENKVKIKIDETVQEIDTIQPQIINAVLSDEDNQILSEIKQRKELNMTNRTI